MTQMRTLQSLLASPAIILLLPALSGAGPIYFATNSPSGMIGPAISQVQTDGTGVRTVFGGAPEPQFRELAIDRLAGKMYFLQEGTTLPGSFRIVRANLDGTGAQVLRDGPPAHDLEVDPIRGKLYIARGSHVVYRMNLDGTGFEELDFHFLGKYVDIQCITLDISEGFLYLSEHESKSIFRASLDGTDVQLVYQIGNANSSITDIEFDELSKQLFWVDVGQLKMQRGFPNGSIQDVIAGNLGFARRLLLDGTNQIAYWSTPVSPFDPGEPGGIFRVGYDGSGISRVLASTGDVHGLDFGLDARSLPIPAPSTLALLGCSIAGAFAMTRRRGQQSRSIVRP